MQPQGDLDPFAHRMANQLGEALDQISALASEYDNGLGTPIEPRALIADYRGGQLTLHLTSQNPRSPTSGRS